MRLSKKIETALNKQINQEMSAAYAYLAASAWFESENYDGFAKWMGVQRSEELEHAQKFITYLLDRGGRLDLAAVEKPKGAYKKPIEVFNAALKSEENNTRSIHELYKLAIDEADYATQSFLKWFIDEQVEEEKIMHDAIGLLEHADDNPSALLVLNERFGARSDADA